MGNIGLPNNFLAGDLAKATEVNANFASIINWSTDGLGGTVKAGIQNDNLGIMTSFIRWDMLTNEQAIKITSTSDVGTISIVQSQALLPDSQGILLKHSAAETNSGASALHVWLDSVSSTVPAIKVTHKGTGNVVVLTDGVDDVFTVADDGDTFIKKDLDVDGSADVAAALDIGTDLAVGGDLDVNGAGPHSISNNLNVDSCDVAGLLTCDTVNATSAAGQSVFTNDVDVQGTLTVGNLSSLLFTSNTYQFNHSSMKFVAPFTSNLHSSYYETGDRGNLRVVTAGSGTGSTQKTVIIYGFVSCPQGTPDGTIFPLYSSQGYSVSKALFAGSTIDFNFTLPQPLQGIVINVTEGQTDVRPGFPSGVAPFRDAFYNSNTTFTIRFWATSVWECNFNFTAIGHTTS